MKDLKGQPVDHSVINTIWEQSWDEDRQWMYYDGPVMWEAQLSAGEKGLVYQSNLEDDEHGARDDTSIRGRYFVFVFNDWPPVKAALMDNNEPFMTWFKKADTIYGVDTSEYRTFSVLAVHKMVFDDLKDEWLPTNDAALSHA